MELKEALISRYNMPLTFVGIEPEKKDLGNFIEYTINNIQKIVISGNGLLMNLDGGKVTLGINATPSNNNVIESRILEIAVVKSESEEIFNTVIDLSSKNAIISYDDNGILTILLQKLNADILEIINGDDRLLSNYPLITYKSEFTTSNTLITTFIYQETPIDIPRAITTIKSSIVTKEDNIISFNKINEVYNKCVDNIDNLNMIFNNLKYGHDLLLLNIDVLYKVSYEDDHITIYRIMVNNDYTITMRPIKMDIIDIILKYSCNIIEIPQYIVYSNAILNDKFEVIDALLPDINDYYSMRDYIDNIDEYCDTDDSEDIILLQAKLLKSKYEKYKEKKYFKDDTLILSNGLVISTPVFNNITEKYIEAVYNSIENKNKKES